MKIFFRYLLSLFFLTYSILLPAQQIFYSVEETETIHENIDKSRWDIGGKPSQYSFRYMSEFFPVGIIQKSDQPYNFITAPKKSIDEIMVRSGSGNISLEESLKKLHVSAFIIVHKGTIAYEKYFSMAPGDKHTIQSISKVLTSLLITNLFNEKKIDINKPIETYIPELKNSDWQGITVRNILHMRSGMDIKSVDFATGPFTNPDHKNYQLESALGILPKAANTPKSVFKFVAAMKKDTAAGLQAAYSNINTFVLGWLAEKVTGKKYQDLIAERIWKPMGASSDAYTCLSETGVAWPHGGISATMRDLARFGMLYTYSEINKRKETLISLSQLKEIFDTPTIPNAPFKWAYQWDIADDGIMIKTGFGGQALYIVPEKEIVIACYNYVDTDWGMTMISEDAINGIIKALAAVK